MRGSVAKCGAADDSNLDLATHQTSSDVRHLERYPALGSGCRFQRLAWRSFQNVMIPAEAGLKSPLAVCYCRGSQGGIKCVDWRVWTFFVPRPLSG